MTDVDTYTLASKVRVLETRVESIERQRTEELERQIERSRRRNDLSLHLMVFVFPMPTVTVVTDIAAPPSGVFGVVADYEQGPRWQPNMRSARWTSTGPRGVGSTFEQNAHFMGRDLTAAYEVTEYDPPRVVAIRSTSGPFPIIVRRVVEAHSDGARVTETSSGGPGGIARVLAPLMRVVLRRTIARDYRHLKELLEQRG